MSPEDVSDGCLQSRVGGNGGAGETIAPKIYMKIGKKVAFSTPTISRLDHSAPQKVISTPNILHLPPGLQRMSPEDVSGEFPQRMF